MHGPATVGWLLAALCAATGACCALRARSTAGTRREESVSETLMCFGMAVMALPDSPFWPPPPALATALYAAVFGTVTVWELRLLVVRGPAHRVHLHHAVGALAMLYMTAATAASPGHGGGHDGTTHGGVHAGDASAGLPLLTGALLAYFACYVLRSGARLMPGGGGAAHGPGGDGVLRQPGVMAGVRLAMGTGMLAMLMTL